MYELAIANSLYFVRNVRTGARISPLFEDAVHTIQLVRRANRLSRAVGRLAY